MGDGADLVGQHSGFPTPTPTPNREDFAPRPRGRQGSVWRVLVVTAGGGVLLASSGQSPGLLHWHPAVHRTAPPQCQWPGMSRVRGAAALLWGLWAIARPLALTPSDPGATGGF